MQQIQLTCSICLSPFQSPTSLFCGHTFCLLCIENSLKNNLSCPLCRKPAMPGHQINEMLLQIIDVIDNSGLEKFPQIVICLDCGLTPINPVLLPCQHLFCFQCTQNNLIEQSCPVCLEPYMITQPIVNQVFNELIQWYYPTIEQLEEKNQKIFGMPIFLFNKQICVHQICQIAIQEDRYKKLIKMAADGSGKFIIVPQTVKFPVYADMVQIKSIAQFVEIQGCDRLRVYEIYCYVNDEKIPLTPQSYQQFSKQLWLCDFEIIRDVPDKSMAWNQISSFLQACFQELSIEMQAALKCSFQTMHILKTNQQKQHYESDSLLLLQFLNISKYEFQQLYYDDNEQTRNQLIWMKLIGIQKQIKMALGDFDENGDEKMIEQEKIIHINQSQIVNVYLDEDENMEDLKQNVVFPNITLSQQIILNIFNLQKMILFQ